MTPKKPPKVETQAWLYTDAEAFNSDRYSLTVGAVRQIVIRHGKGIKLTNDDRSVLHTLISRGETQAVDELTHIVAAALHRQQVTTDEGPADIDDSRLRLTAFHKQSIRRILEGGISKKETG